MSAPRLIETLCAWALCLATGMGTLQAQSDVAAPPDSATLGTAGMARWGMQANLGPLASRLAVIDGVTLQRGESVLAEVELCNPTDRHIDGRVSILSTTAWKAQPGREFPYHLTPSDTCFKQRFSVALLEEAGPGPYDLVLRVEADGRELGTLRTRFVRPFEWLLIGPFPAIGDTEPLPPEEGIRLEGSHPGLGGPVSWRRPAAYAYDASGSLEADLVLGPATTPRCACAFTIFDVSNDETLHWKAPGAQRLILDGRTLVTGRPFHLTPGRHTLLARLCSEPSGWRLGLTLLREDGTWPRTLENNLTRFLPGFGDTWGKEDTTPSMRHVVLQVRHASAHEVDVLGSFNAWVPWRLEHAGPGLWKRDLVLPPGRHAYKLRVDGILMPDTSAERSEPDGFGGTNSLLIVR